MPRLNPDPIDDVNRLGYRVVWLDDLGGDVFLIDEARVVLADVDLSREDVADAVLRRRT